MVKDTLKRGKYPKLTTQVVNGPKGTLVFGRVVEKRRLLFSSHTDH
jgi:hypothetical protein